MKSTQLPVLPNVAMQIMQFNPDSQSSDGNAFEKIIAPDQGVSAELLKMANSSFYGHSGRIKNIKEAITLLGVKAAKNLTIVMITRSLKINLKGPVYRLYLNEYPVIAALIASDLAVELGQKKLSEDAFVSALLHRVGMTIMALNHPDHYNVILDQCAKNGWELRKMEQDSYKTTHAALTLEAFASWNLPAAMQSTAKNIDFPAGRSGEQQELTLITELADIIAAKLLSLDIASGSAEKEKAILNPFGKGVETTYKYTPEFYEKLKEHPFYKQAMTG